MLKRVLAILLSSVLLLGVVSCAKDSETAEDTTDTQTEAPFAEESDGDDQKEDKKEDKKEEVITLEALNTAPVVSDVSGKDKWMNLHGDEFFKYLREHPEIR